MMQVLSISIPVFFVIFMGYVCGKKEIISSSASKVMSLYVFYFCMPLFLFLSMSKIPVHEALHLPYIFAYGTSLIAIGLLALGAGQLVFSYSASETALHVMGTSYTNSAYLGIPLLSLAFGDVTPVVLVTIFQVLLITPLIILVLEIDQRRREGKGGKFLDIPLIAIKNPIVIGSLAGIGAAFIHLPIPQTLIRVCELVGPAGAPTALFSIGLSLSDKKNVITKDMRQEVTFMVIGKMLLHPLAAYLIGKFIFNLSPQWLAPLVLMAAMPTAMNNFLFAQKYGAYLKQSSAVVMTTTFVAVFTISAILYLLGIAR